MTDENPRLWRVQRPKSTPHLCSDMELFKLAERESGYVGNPTFRGNTPQAAKNYLQYLGFRVEVL